MPAGIGFVEVAGVAVYGVYHVAFAICYDGRILGSNVVQELLQLHHCVDCGLHLLQCKCADGGKDGAVDAAYQSSVPRTCWRCFCCALLTGGEASVCVIFTQAP